MQDPETPAPRDVRRLTRGARLRYAEIGLVVAATSCATSGTALTGRHRPRRAKSRPVIGSCSPPDRPERRLDSRAGGRLERECVDAQVSANPSRRRLYAYDAH